MSSTETPTETFQNLDFNEVEKTIGIALTGPLSLSGRILPSEWLCGVCAAKINMSLTVCTECQSSRLAPWMRTRGGEIIAPGQIVRLPSGWQPISEPIREVLPNSPHNKVSTKSKVPAEARPTKLPSSHTTMTASVVAYKVAVITEVVRRLRQVRLIIYRFSL